MRREGLCAFQWLVGINLGKQSYPRANATDRGLAEIEAFAQGLEALDEAVTRTDAAATRRYLGTGYYKGGVYTPGCVLMQPAALVRGLARALPINVDLYEDSPVVAITYGARVRAETPRGAVSAPRLVLCSEAFTPAFGSSTASRTSSAAARLIPRPS